ERDRSQAREVLEVVGDERVPHRKRVHEPERRAERRDEEQERDERPAAGPGREREERACSGEHPDRERELPRRREIERPARVDEGEGPRPKELAEVEPDGATRDQAT